MTTNPQRKTRWVFSQDGENKEIWDFLIDRFEGKPLPPKPVIQPEIPLELKPEKDEKPEEIISKETSKLEIEEVKPEECRSASELEKTQKPKKSPLLNKNQSLMVPPSGGLKSSFKEVAEKKVLLQQVNSIFLLFLKPLNFKNSKLN